MQASPSPSNPSKNSPRSIGGKSTSKSPPKAAFNNSDIKVDDIFNQTTSSFKKSLRNES